jgi:hypothetical protein
MKDFDTPSSESLARPRAIIEEAFVNTAAERSGPVSQIIRVNKRSTEKWRNYENSYLPGSI